MTVNRAWMSMTATWLKISASNTAVEVLDIQSSPRPIAHWPGDVYWAKLISWAEAACAGQPCGNGPPLPAGSLTSKNTILIYLFWSKTWLLRLWVWWNGMAGFRTCPWSFMSFPETLCRKLFIQKHDMTLFWKCPFFFSFGAWNSWVRVDSKIVYLSLSPTSFWKSNMPQLRWLWGWCIIRCCWHWRRQWEIWNGPIHQSKPYFVFSFHWQQWLIEYAVRCWFRRPLGCWNRLERRILVWVRQRNMVWSWCRTVHYIDTWYSMCICYVVFCIVWPGSGSINDAHGDYIEHDDVSGGFDEDAGYNML